jgi:kinesin family protein C2/C3
VGSDLHQQELTHEATSKALFITVRKVEALQEDNAALAAQAEAAQRDLDDHGHRLGAAQSALAAARIEAAELEALVERSAEREAALAGEVAQLGAACEARAAEAAAARGEAQALRAAVAAARREAAQRQEAAAATVAQLEAQVAASAELADGLASALEQCRAEMRSAQAAAAAAQREAASAAAAAAEWKAAAEGAAAAAAAQAADGDAIRAARTVSAKELQALRSRLDTSQAQAEDFQRRFLAERLERRRAHEELQTLRGNIRVVARVRPAGAAAARGPSAVTFPFPGALCVATPDRGTYNFEFSATLAPSASQGDTFDEVWPALRSCCDGFNVCIFAYGQTSSGKTHTVVGSAGDPGLAPRALAALFDITAREAREGLGTRVVSISAIEIYNDVVRDLLAADRQGAAPPSPGSARALEVSALGPFSAEQLLAGAERVPGRVWRQVGCPAEAVAALEEGSRARATSATALNTRSSRSHMLLAVRLSDPGGVNPPSTLHLVDLAGSERVARSEAEGQALKEAQAINKSLSALGDVVAALQARSPHVPFRNSKLTMVLQDSLSGSSKVLLLCCVAPEAAAAQETATSLAFAQRAAQVETGPAKRVGDAAAAAAAQKQQVAGAPGRRAGFGLVGGGGGASPRVAGGVLRERN